MVVYVNAPRENTDGGVGGEGGRRTLSVFSSRLSVAKGDMSDCNWSSRTNAVDSSARTRTPDSTGFGRVPASLALKQATVGLVFC